MLVVKYRLVNSSARCTVELLIVVTTLASMAVPNTVVSITRVGLFERLAPVRMYILGLLLNRSCYIV